VRGDVVHLQVDPTPDDEDDDPEPLDVSLTVERMEGRRIDRVTLTVQAPDGAAAETGSSRAAEPTAGPAADPTGGGDVRG
jgi:ribosomal protein L12E/L44/L45/RPP1/RPP2